MFTSLNYSSIHYFKQILGLFQQAIYSLMNNRRISYFNMLIKSQINQMIDYPSFCSLNIFFVVIIIFSVNYKAVLDTFQKFKEQTIPARRHRPAQTRFGTGE